MDQQKKINQYWKEINREIAVLKENSLKNADILYVHNKLDVEYYRGITEHKDIRILPSLMVTDRVNDLPEVEREGVMIGGNFVSWYGGFDSYVVAKSIEKRLSLFKIYVFIIGTKKCNYRGKQVST